MARILVQTDSGTTLLDERHVSVTQLDTEHSAANLLERLAWALDEADRRRERRREHSPRHLQPVTSGFGRTFD